MSGEKEEVVVYISGTWDLLHYGHVRVLKAAKELGEKLVVGVNTDEYAKKLGKDLVMSFEERREVIDGLSCVESTVPHNSGDCVGGMRVYGVKIRATGPDWWRVTGQEVARDKMKSMGIKVVVLPRTEGISSSLVRERIKTEVMVK